MKIKLLVCSILFGLSTFAQNITHKEMLSRPTNSSVTIQLFFDEAIDFKIEYGTTSNALNLSSNWKTFQANESAEETLTNLLEDTQYFYRVLYKKTGTSTVLYRPEFTFHTQRKKGSAFTFVIQADPHLDEQSDTALYRVCLNNELADKPDFMIDLGDFLMSDKLRTSAKIVPKDTITYRSHLLRSYYETLCHSVPLYIALGNHEGEAGWMNNGTADNIAVWGANDRKKYFKNPIPDGFYTGDTTNNPFIGLRENYYAWNWGDAQFIVIDPYWYTETKPDSLHGWNWTLGKVQYDWLKTTLEQSDAKFKFVLAHQLVGGAPDGRGGIEFADLYEWGGNNLDGTRGFETNRPGWYKPIKDLLTENRVNIFFHGHDHFFGKQEKECLIYQETPQPSHPNFTSTAYATAYGYVNGQILPNSGHLRIKVDENGTQVEYVRAYLPKSENNNRHNRDVSASYYIPAINCYDNQTANVPVIWNSDYTDEIIYPNPFQNQTTIKFTVTETQNTNLNIYDAQGNSVRELLINKEFTAGNYEVIWDGKDSFNHELPSGTYYYSFSNSFHKNKRNKLILQH